MQEYLKWTRSTWGQAKHNIPYDEMHALLGLVTEVAELADVMKKDIYYGKEFPKDKIKDELGDVLYYLARYIDAIGSSFEEIAAANKAKLVARFGDKFDAAKAINKDTVAEDKAQRKVFGEDLQD